MNTDFAHPATSHLKSSSQIVRVISEAWFEAEAYCLACESPKVEKTRANTAAKDFLCPVCKQSYELKSGSQIQGKRVVDGAYRTMLERVRSNDPPLLVLLSYRFSACPPTSLWSVEHLTAIHPVFLTDSVIEARKPLSAGARRAGWQGCNIRIDRIPPDGRITLVENGRSVEPPAVRKLYQASRRLSDINADARGWTALVLNIVRQIGTKTFSLADVYAHKSKLQQAFPQNRNIEPKIRQQLQVLRDLGYISFCSKGTYEVIPIS